MLFDTIVSREFIPKGWSGDRKYRAADSRGNFYLLRIAAPERQARREGEFLRMRQAAALGIPMCRPLEFGTCPEGVFTLLSWVEGQDAEEYIPTLDPSRQYAYGLDAGRILAKLHTIPAPADAEDWETRFNKKIDRKLRMYAECPLEYENGDAFQRFIEAHRHLLSNRPQCYQHGDYHIGNMMVSTDDTLTVIDFEKDDWGDPWEEFNRIVWSAQAAPAFASGMVDGYFPNGVPGDFWALLALYISSNTFSSLPWAIPFGENEIATMKNQAAQVLSWYNGMHSTIPSWYQKP